MSNAVSVLGGKVAEGPVAVRDAGLRGMITLRGDLSDQKLQEVCTKLTGATFPAKGQVTSAGENGICWMSPDELLLLVSYGAVGEALEEIGKALSGTHHLAANVSDARGMMTVAGADARDVVAKLTPVDLHPDSFGVGELRRTRLGQVAAAFWMSDETTFNVICFRSVAQYTFDLLATSAQAGPVDYLSQA